jgi:lipoyl(octanoyl) transferase
MTDWAVSDGLTGYPQALAAMEARVCAILAGEADELVWLLEHPPLYTRGTSARPEDLIDAAGIPVFDSQRGGQFTYHGPGQRVAYVMLDLTRRGRDIKEFVCGLEGWIIDTLDAFNVKGERRPGRVGVWVPRTGPDAGGREDKIAAIGVRVRRWVSFHGISLNVEPDLSHFQGIVPCGIADPDLGVTSLCALGRTASLTEVDIALAQTFERRFGPIRRTPPPE